jgi:hypothetical protein
MVYISMVKSHDINQKIHSIDYDTHVLWNLLVVNYYAVKAIYNGHNMYKTSLLPIYICEYVPTSYISMIQSQDIFPNTHSIDYDTQILLHLLVVNY